MLDAFIIEELKKRERLRHRQDKRPTLEIPLDSDESPCNSRNDHSRNQKDRESGRVIIIDYGV